jgi:preprotein translocase subunit Sss1
VEELMEPNQNTIEKIQKLLALSKSPNENEASVALKMAMDMLSKHNLSMSEINVEKKETVEQEEVKFTGKNFSTWRTLLLNAIADSHYCNILKVHGTGIYYIIGKHTNRQATLLMFQYLSNVVEFECKVNMADKALTKTEGKTYANSFKLGMVHRLTQRLQEKKNSIILESKSNALIKVDPYAVSKAENQEYIRNKYKVHQAQERTNNINNSAYYQGDKAGQRVGLNGSRAITA